MLSVLAVIFIEDRNFISQKMKILMSSIDSKLEEGAVILYRHQLEMAISFFVKCVRMQVAYGYRCDPASFEDSPAEKAINKYYIEEVEKFDSAEAAAVLDSIRHAFCSFAYNGVHQLFSRQENESWYPKVVLDCELKPNSIDSLPEEVVLYRGTDVLEYDQASFGQSWSTEERVAHDFAYKHYESQSWFKREVRVVLKTRYSRRFVYYASLAPEYEVVVDVGRIGRVERIA